MALRRKRGKFRLLPAFDRRESCDLITYATLGRPVFGGKKRNKPVRLKFRLAESADVEAELRLKNGKLIKRANEKSYPSGKRNVIRFKLPKGARRGAYRVSLSANRAGRASAFTLFTRYR